MKGTDAIAEPRRRGSIFGWLLFALMVLLVLVLGRASLPSTVGEQARQLLLGKLVEHYRDLDVSIARGHFEPGVGFVFDGIEFRQPSAFNPNASFVAASRLYQNLLGDPRPTIARIDRLVVMADMDWKKLTQQENPFRTKKMIVDGASVDFHQLADGHWSVEQLLPMPMFGPVCPKMEIRNVRLRLSDPGAPDRVLDAFIGEVSMRAQTQPDGTIHKQIQLTGNSPFIRHFRLNADCKGDSHAVQLDMQAVSVHRGLIDLLPRSLSALVVDAHGLSCVLDLSLFARSKSTPRPTSVHDSGKQSVWKKLSDDWVLGGSLTVKEGQFRHPVLPMPLDQLRAKAHFDQQGVVLETSQATFGDAICRVAGQLDELNWPANADLHVVTDGLLLDDRLSSVLPAKLRPGWQRLQPSGRVDVDARLRHQMGKWTTQATLDCKGVDVRFDKFPYPAKHLTGKVEVANERATCRLMNGRIGDQQVRCQFSIPTKPRAQSDAVPEPFYFECDSGAAIPINEELLASLTPRGENQTGLEKFVRSLDCGGSLHLVSAMLKRDATGKLHRRINVQVRDGRLTYEKFRYPLFNVHGEIQVNDDLVRINDFQANNASGGSVRCNGTFLMPARVNATPIASLDISRQGRPAATSSGVLPDSSRLDLVFHAQDVPMDESLRLALPAASRSTWDAISPSGVLDRLVVGVVREGLDPIQLDVEARQNEIDRVESRTLSLRPTAIPYRLDVVGGTVRFGGDNVTITDFEGRHGGSLLAAEGTCRPQRDGRWLLSLDVLSGSRLVPDAELNAALPGPVSQTMRRLQLRGPVGVRGMTQVLLPRREYESPIIDWDVTMQLEGNRIADVGPVHSLRGELKTRGRHDGSHLRAAGEILLDSMHVHQLQITGLRGPFSIEDDGLLIGQLARPLHRVLTVSTASGQEATPVSGWLFGGSFQINGTANLTESEFDVGLSVTDAKVPILLADLGFDDQGLKGVLVGEARVRGVLGDMERLEGQGKASMSGANIYQLPLIIQIFNQLSIKPTEAVAITDGDCEFTLDGRDINFLPLKLWGNLVELSGGGQVIRGKELDLSFDTRVSPQNSFTKVFSPLRTQPYALWTIDVTGPIGSQTIQRRALDRFGETLERLFPSMTNASGGNSREGSLR